MGPGREPGQAVRPRSTTETRPAFQVRCWLADEQARQPATTSTMFLLIRKACDARLWGDGGGGWYVEICAGSLGPTFREGGTWRGVYGRQTLPQDEHLPRKMRDALGPRDQLSPLVVHRCAASSLSCSYHGRSLVRKLATDNISKLNLK